MFHLLNPNFCCFNIERTNYIPFFIAHVSSLARQIKVFWIMFDLHTYRFLCGRFFLFRNCEGGDKLSKKSKYLSKSHIFGMRVIFFRSECQKNFRALWIKSMFDLFTVLIIFTLFGFFLQRLCLPLHAPHVSHNPVSFRFFSLKLLLFSFSVCFWTNQQK